MLRRLLLVVTMLLVSGCGKVAELTNQTRTVAAPREEVFAKMFGDDGLPLVTNGGSTRLYELVIDRSDPAWAQVAPKLRPDAYKVKFAVAMEIPRGAHMIYSIDDGALSTGLKFTFDELAPDRTRVAFSIDELSGSDSEGLRVNAAKLRSIARDALKKLDDFDEVKDAA